jgi:hypothetical protein
MKTTLDGVVTVVDTITCCHHNTVHDVPFGADLFVCLKCMAYQCEVCETTGACVPFERQLDRLEAKVNRQLAREASRRSMGL